MTLEQLYALPTDFYSIRPAQDILESLIARYRLDPLLGVWDGEVSDPIYLYSDALASYLHENDSDMNQAVLNTTLLASGDALKQVAARSGIFLDGNETDNQIRLKVLLERTARSGITTEPQIIANAALSSPNVVYAYPMMMSDGHRNLVVVSLNPGDSTASPVVLPGTPSAATLTAVSDYFNEARGKVNVGDRFYPVAPFSKRYKVDAVCEYRSDITTSLDNLRTAISASIRAFAALNIRPNNTISRLSIQRALLVGGVTNVPLISMRQPTQDLIEKTTDYDAATWPYHGSVRVSPDLDPGLPLDNEKLRAIQSATVYACFYRESDVEFRANEADAATKDISIFLKDVSP